MTSRAGIALVMGLLVLAVLVAALVSARALAGPTFHGTTYEGVPAADFELLDHAGAPIRLSDLRGRPVLVFFGFTRCPDTCPMTLDRLRRALDGAGRRAQDTAILLVTVDPERDTPAVLARYVRGFGPHVVGVTGDPDALHDVHRAYGVHVATPTGEGHHQGHGGSGLAHSAAIYGVDREGILRVVIPSDHPEEWIRDDIRSLARL